jgi:hypothetical protein
MFKTTDEVKAVRMKTAWCPHKKDSWIPPTPGHPVGHMTVYRILRTSGLSLTHNYQRESDERRLKKEEAIFT